MKLSDHEAHIQKFQLNFIGQAFSEVHNHTLEDLFPGPTAQSLGDVLARGNSLGPEGPLRSSSKTQKKAAKPVPQGPTLAKMYLFNVTLWIIEVIIAYIFFFTLILIEDKLKFPAFNCLLALTLTFIIQPFQPSNLFIVVLGIPMVIANYYLQVELLTYCELLLLYFTIYMFNEYYKMSVLWILNIFLLGSFGLLALPKISEEMQLYVFYFIFPFLLLLVRLVLVLAHHSIKHYSEPLLQPPLFLLGLQYGVLMTTGPSTVQFWFMIIMFTLQIVDERLQFMFKLLKKLIKASKQNSRWVLTAKCSAHVCLNSFHIVILIYIVCATQLKTIAYSQSLNSYIQDSGWEPLIIWACLSLHELASMVKVINREDLFVKGAQHHHFSDVFRRIVCLSLGLWLFYLGLCIPHALLL